jgi:hypothetical protein
MFGGGVSALRLFNYPGDNVSIEARLAMTQTSSLALGSTLMA